MTVDQVKNLHTALVDSRAAYELALKDTNDPAVAEVRREMISLRHDDHMALHQSLVLAGEVPDENGSFMSIVHETVIGVPAAISGITKKTLPAFASGEEDIVSLYDRALEETASDDPTMSEILTVQRDNLLKKIAQIRNAAAS